MRTTTKNDSIVRICGAWILCALLPLAAAVPLGKGQTASEVGFKTLKVGGGGLRDPFYIIKVTVGGSEMLLGKPLGLHPKSNLIFPGRPFQAGNDWLGSMTIYMRNRTNKNVVFVDIPMGFPETGDGRTAPQLIYHARLGRLPATDAFDAKTGRPLVMAPGAKPVSVAPGQTLLVDIAHFIPQIKAHVESVMPFMMVTKCTIYGTKGCFEDGTCWAGDSFSAPDPSHPGRRKPLGPGYFPGDPHQYWPPGS
jgi:hypothetical protein